MRSTFSPSIIFLWSFLRLLLLFYLFFFSYSLQQTRYDIGIYLYVRMLRMVSFPSHVEILRIVFYNAAKPHFYPIRRGSPINLFCVPLRHNNGGISFAEHLFHMRKSSGVQQLDLILYGTRRVNMVKFSQWYV